MKAEKVTINITVEALSVDTLDSLVAKACEQIRGEFENGELLANDGDTVKWTTCKQKVEF